MHFLFMVHEFVSLGSGADWSLFPLNTAEGKTEHKTVAIGLPDTEADEGGRARISCPCFQRVLQCIKPAV
jgi:hypothetical protein